MANLGAELMPNFNSAGENSPYFTNAPAKEKRVICGVNCNCPRRRINASDKAIPGYNYIKYLGEGSYGAVHLYRDQKMHKTVAIKSILYRTRNGVNIFHEVESEYDIAIYLAHPNITKYYKFFTNPNTYTCYIVMEYAMRGSLRKVITDQVAKQEYFDRALVLRVIHHILSGVHYLNSQHILHCDLKPENILVGNDGLMKICDFGTAHFVYDVNAPLSGTIIYMAPEIFQNVRPNEKSELWSIGVILYELCNLQHPFKYAFTLNTGKFIPNVIAGNISPTNCYYGSGMKDLLGAMLNVKPEERYTLVDCLKLCRLLKQRL